MITAKEAKDSSDEKNSKEIAIIKFELDNLIKSRSSAGFKSVKFNIKYDISYDIHRYLEGLGYNVTYEGHFMSETKDKIVILEIGWYG